MANREVVATIREILQNPRIDYGYRKMWGDLTLKGYLINHKKVYRLMKQARLLRPKSRKGLAKDYVKYRIVCPEEPLRLLEMDIKMVWLNGSRRYGYILSIIDVFTRVVLNWQVGLHMRQQHVEQAWKEVIQQHFEPHHAFGWETHIEIRSDNGPQFCANKLRQFFKDNYLMQTFTHPYTPQENGHIESFHAILSNDLNRNTFFELDQLKAELTTFFPFYNYKRIHGSTLKLPPITFWKLWQENLIDRKVICPEKRKVKFSLKIERQNVTLVKLSDNVSLRLLSAHIPEKHKMGRQACATPATFG